jgi:hypothetical protein
MRTLLLNATFLSALPLFMAETEGSGGEPVADPKITANSVITINATVPVLKQFDAANPAAFGNSYLETLVKITDFDSGVEEAVKASEDSKRFAHFELVKAVLSAEEKVEDINIYSIFENVTKSTEKLNNKILQYFGVIEKKIVDDEIEIIWSSPELKGLYDYASVDKEKDANEHQKRFTNRKRLNMRLSEAFKAAAALKDLAVKADDLQLVENPETKIVEPTINNAPAALRGDTEKNKSTSVKFGQRTAQEGAKVAANTAALVKAATEVHRKKDSDATGTGERSDKGSERSGDAKMGISDEDFGEVVNNLRKIILAQEGQLSDEQVKQLSNLVPFIDEQLKVAAATPKTENLDEISDEDRTTEDVDGTELSQEEIDNGGRVEEAAAPATAAAAPKNPGRKK